MDKGRERLSNDREVLGVEPVEEESKVLLRVQPMHDALEDVKQLKQLSLNVGISLQSRLVEGENLCDYVVQLRYVNLEIFHEVFVHPEAGEDLEELAQMLVVGVVLKDFELHLYLMFNRGVLFSYHVILNQLYYELRLAYHPAAGRRSDKHIEGFQRVLYDLFTLLGVAFSVDQILEHLLSE